MHDELSQNDSPRSNQSAGTRQDQDGSNQQHRPIQLQNLQTGEQASFDELPRGEGEESESTQNMLLLQSLKQSQISIPQS